MPDEPLSPPRRPQVPRRVGDRIVDRLAMAIYDAEAVCGITQTPPINPCEFYDAIKARGAYPASQREARRVAWFALRFFFTRRRGPTCSEECPHGY